MAAAIRHPLAKKCRFRAAHGTAALASPPWVTKGRAQWSCPRDNTHASHDDEDDARRNHRWSSLDTPKRRRLVSLFGRKPRSNNPAPRARERNGWLRCCFRIAGKPSNGDCSSAKLLVGRNCHCRLGPAGLGTGVLLAQLSVRRLHPMLRG